MPEVMRFIAARLRRFVADRRSARRVAVRLRCTVGLAAGRVGRNGARRAASLDGYTYDISETGMRLFMPAIHIDGHYLTGAGSTLTILLELPDGPMLIQAVAVRYDHLDENTTDMSHLIGVRITEMSDADRKRFLALMK